MSVSLEISTADKSWMTTIPDGATVKGGRSPKAQIHIPDKTVSSFHFQLRNIPGGWVLKDLQSTNGTFVNSEKISDIALQEGDVIKAGNCTIVFHLGATQTEQPTDTDSQNISRQAETVPDNEIE